MLYIETVTALDHVVEECLHRDPALPCYVMEIMGLQRVRLQTMSKEAVLQKADHEVAYYRARMHNTTGLSTMHIT